MWTHYQQSQKARTDLQEKTVTLTTFTSCLSSILLVYSIHIIPYEPNGTFHSSSLHTYTLITIMQICESHTGNGTH